MNLKCTICGKPLQGDLDTYGEYGFEACWDCWSELMFGGEMGCDLTEIAESWWAGSNEDQPALPFEDDEMEMWE